MNSRASVLTALALASAAGAQNPFTIGSTATYTLAFVEIGRNTNGILEPGESALIQISIAFSNQFTTASYTPPTPAPGSGTIRGFGWAFIDLNGTANNGGNAEGEWDLDFVSPWGPIRDGWDPVGPPGWGTPVSNGARLTNIQISQYVGQYPIYTTNPIDLIYQALWTPSTYSDRTVTFAPAPAAPAAGLASGVLLRVSTTGIAWASCPSEFGSVSIPIIPTPAGTLVFTLSLLPRRRRPRAEAPP